MLRTDPPRLDDKDRLILDLIQEDGRITNADLAQRVNLSPSACLRRVQALHASGLIAGTVTLVDAQAAGLGCTVVVEVALERQAEEALDAFERAVQASVDISECYLMAGEADYLLRVSCRDTADFERIHRQVLSRLPGVARLRSRFTIRTVSKRTAIRFSRSPEPALAPTSDRTS